MKKPLIFLFFGVLIGVGISSAIIFSDPNRGSVKTDSKPETVQQSTKPADPVRATAKIDSPIDAKAVEDKKEVTSTDATDDQTPDPVKQFSKLLNSPEARNLIGEFAKNSSANSSRWISREIERRREALGLSDEQVELLNDKITQKVKKDAEKLAADMQDEGKNVGELLAQQGDWQGRIGEIEESLSEVLDSEQMEKYEALKRAEQTERVQRSSERELDYLTQNLELSEVQQDQVFSILVQTSPEYDSSMRVGGVESTYGIVIEPGQERGEVRKDAVRSVLDESQQQKYQELESTRRVFPWMRGR